MVLDRFVNRLLGRIEPIDPDKLLVCPVKDCKERGDYLKCYYDKFPDCKTYWEHKRQERR